MLKIHLNHSHSHRHRGGNHEHKIPSEIHGRIPELTLRDSITAGVVTSFAVHVVQIIARVHVLAQVRLAATHQDVIYNPCVAVIFIVLMATIRRVVVISLLCRARLVRGGIALIAFEPLLLVAALSRALVAGSVRWVVTLGFLGFAEG
uniref:(northern house mosquito) hypothetical protein n=1 Tax=Culex pipiens TaxID=7175 RepID=A0A8D8HA03_CULPI